MRFMTLCGLVLVLGLCGCSTAAISALTSTKGSFACDEPKGGSNGTHSCFEQNWAAGLFTATYAASCKSAGGTSVGSCSHTNALGGCKIGSTAAYQTVWYYTDAKETKDQIKTACTSACGSSATDKSVVCGWVDP